MAQREVPCSRTVSFKIPQEDKEKKKLEGTAREVYKQFLKLPIGEMPEGDRGGESRSLTPSHEVMSTLEDSGFEPTDASTPRPSQPRIRSHSFQTGLPRVPPDQMDQVPILVAETLRYIADNRLGRQTEQHLLRQVERMLHNAGDETDVIVDEFQHQLQQLVAQNNDLNLQNSVKVWVEGLMLVKVLLSQSVTEEQGELQNALEDIFVKVFQEHNMLDWLSNSLIKIWQGLQSFCQHCLVCVSSLSPIRRTNSDSSKLKRSKPGEQDLQEVEESGFFEGSSTSMPSLTTTDTPTSSPRPIDRKRNSSFSSLVSSPTAITVTTAGLVVAGYMYAMKK